MKEKKMEDSKQHLLSSAVAEQTNPAIYTCTCARRVLHKWHWLRQFSATESCSACSTIGTYFAQLIFVN